MCTCQGSPLNHLQREGRRARPVGAGLRYRAWTSEQLKPHAVGCPYSLLLKHTTRRLLEGASLSPNTKCENGTTRRYN